VAKTGGEYQMVEDRGLDAGEVTIMKRQLLAFALAAAVAGPSALAVTDAQLKAVKKSVNAVPVPELPAKAAELVTQSSKEDREIVAITAVRAAIHKSRSSAPLVVAAVSKAAPELAGPVSQVAAELEAGQSDSIAAAAMGAAPHAKAEIASGVQRGVYGGGDSSLSSLSSVSSPVSLGGTHVSTAAIPMVSPTLGASPFTFTPRGAADSSHGGHVEIHHTPINNEHGGDGHGRFPEHPPFVIPPGHDPDHHGRPDFVDYTKPRHF
jgi:hypothetical protein